MQLQKVSKSVSYVIKDMYIDYLNHVDTNSGYDVDFKIYNKICQEYFMYIAKCIVDNGEDFKLPYNCGILSVKKKKMHFYASQLYSVDFKTSRLYHKKIIYDNSHSDNYKYFFRWERKNSKLKNKTKYQFVATRTWKRKLAKNIIVDSKDYIEV